MLQSPIRKALKLQSCIHAFGYCLLVPQFHTLLEPHSSSKFQLLASKTLTNTDEPEPQHLNPRFRYRDSILLNFLTLSGYHYFEHSFLHPEETY